MAFHRIFFYAHKKAPIVGAAFQAGMLIKIVFFFFLHFRKPCSIIHISGLFWTLSLSYKGSPAISAAAAAQVSELSARCTAAEALAEEQKSRAARLESLTHATAAERQQMKARQGTGLRLTGWKSFMSKAIKVIKNQ